MFEYAIIGKGMIGAAAGRYVSQISDSVVIIGPDEPAEPWSQHQGVFASHYDQGRITRELDSNPVWAELAQRSIAEYENIETASGIHFYHPCGGIQVGPVPQKPDDYMARTESTAQQLGTEYCRYSGQEFCELYPALSIREEYRVLHEPTVAGYINPRELVAAQTKIAQQQGATETERLQNLPSVIFYEGINDPDLTGIYMLPPIRYPDGETYIKIGGRLNEVKIPQSADELQAWFRSDGSGREAEALENALFAILPGLQAEELVVKPCAITMTETGEPLLAEVAAGRIAVVAGGCGAAAKSSNEIGRLGAELVLGLS